MAGSAPADHVRCRAEPSLVRVTLSRSGGAGRITARYSMERRRFFRNPLLWVLIVVAVSILATTQLTGGDDYKTVKWSELSAQITADNVKKAVQKDKEQTVQLELKEKFQGST